MRKLACQGSNLPACMPAHVRAECLHCPLMLCRRGVLLCGRNRAPLLQRRKYLSWLEYRLDQRTGGGSSPSFPSRSFKAAKFYCIHGIPQFVGLIGALGFW